VKKLIVGSIAVTGLLLASCGGSGDGGAAGTTSKVDQVLDKLAGVVTAEGGTFDRDCAKEQVEKMDVADLQTLIDSKLEDDVTLSDDGEAIGDAITSCITLPVDTTEMATVDTGALDDTATGDTIDITGMSPDELREQLTALLSGSFAGMTIDEQCVRDAVGKLSDDDLRAIVAAGENGDPTVSAEADAIGESLVECVTDFGDELDTSGTGPIPDGIAMTDALIDVFVQQIEATGMQADRPCVEQALEGVDVAQLADVMNNSELMTTLSACITP
jgi:hypothetical protein